MRPEPKAGDLFTATSSYGTHNVLCWTGVIDTDALLSFGPAVAHTLANGEQVIFVRRARHVLMASGLMLFFTSKGLAHMYESNLTPSSRPRRSNPSLSR